MPTSPSSSDGASAEYGISPCASKHVLETNGLPHGGTSLGVVGSHPDPAPGECTHSGTSTVCATFTARPVCNVTQASHGRAREGAHVSEDGISGIASPVAVKSLTSDHTVDDDTRNITDDKRKAIGVASPEGASESPSDDSENDSPEHCSGKSPREDFARRPSPSVPESKSSFVTRTDDTADSQSASRMNANPRPRKGGSKDKSVDGLLETLNVWYRKSRKMSRSCRCCGMSGTMCRVTFAPGPGPINGGGGTIDV